MLNQALAWWYGFVLEDSDDGSLASLLDMSLDELLNMLEICGLISRSSNGVVKVYAEVATNWTKTYSFLELQYYF